MSQSSLKPIYIDQNVLSALQKSREERDFLLQLFRDLRQKENCIFVFSDVLVSECQQSTNAAEFADILVELEAVFFENALDVSSSELRLVGGKAHSLVLCDQDVAEQAMAILNQFLIPVQYSMGWLSQSDEAELKLDMRAEVERFFAQVAKDVPTEFASQLRSGKEQIFASIDELDWSSLSAESNDAYRKLRSRLPDNYAQLDDVPDNEVAQLIIGSFEPQDRDGITQLYPAEFWSDLNDREYGALSSFAFMLSLTGLVRDKRVRKGEKGRRLQHFLGQWRDCQHIEIAARCQAFLTFDKDAARLAKSVYAYSGVSTEVIHLVKA